MHNAMNSQYKYDLLKLSDFYYDELCDLFADFYNIEDYSEMEDEKIDELTRQSSESLHSINDWESNPMAALPAWITIVSQK